MPFKANPRGAYRAAFPDNPGRRQPAPSPHPECKREQAGTNGRFVFAGVQAKRRAKSSLRKTAGEYYVQAGGSAVWTFCWELPQTIGQGVELTLTDPLDDQLTLAFSDGKPCVELRYSNRAGEVSSLDPSLYTVACDKQRRKLTVALQEGEAFVRLAQALLPGPQTACLFLELVTDVDREAAGVIHNTGVLCFTDREGCVIRAIPQRDPCVEVIGFGGICIHKCDADSGQPLPGAQFEVYGSKEAACVRKHPLVNACATDGAWPSTDVNGFVHMSGLLYTGHGAAYWVVETRAPAVPGKTYSVLEEPVRAWVDAKSHLPERCITVFNCAWDEPPHETEEPTPDKVFGVSDTSHCS